MLPHLLTHIAFVVAASAQAPSSEPALEIDGVPVAFEEFACWLVPFHGEAYVPRFVDLKLLERAAAAEEVVVTRERIAGAVEAQIAQRVQTAFGGDAQAWREELARLDQTEAEHRAERELDEYGISLLTELVVRRRSTDEATVRAEWERTYGLGGRRLELRWIHLAVPPTAAPPGATRQEIAELARVAREEVEREALALSARLSKGADFAELAREHSDDEHTRTSGGVPPANFDLHELGREVEEGVRALAVGAVSAPLFGRGGYNVLRAEAETITPFAAVADELEAALLAQPVTAVESQALLDELRQGVELEVLPELARVVRGDPGDVASWRMERPVLRIGAELVSRAQFAGWLCAARGRAYVRTFAEQRIVEAAAREAGLELASADVERRVYDDLQRSIELNFNGERERWLAEIEANGQTEASWLRMARVRTRHDLLAERLMLARRVIGEDDVRRGWEERYGPGGRNPDVRFLLRSVPEPEPGTVTTKEELERYLERVRAETTALLAELRTRVDDGEDFATLVALYSQDPATKDRGGRPPGRFELHTWGADVQAAILELKPGGVTAPIAIGYEHFLFQLVGMRTVPLEEVRDALARELREARPSMVEVRGFSNALYMEHVVRSLPGLMARRPGPAQ